MWELVRANRRRSVLLVAVLGLMLLGVGYAAMEIASPGAGLLGLPLAFLVWAGMSLASYFAGDRIFLATSGARPIARDDHPVLWNVVEEMKIASGLEHMPAVYLIDSAAPNAFATGRDPEHAAVAVTSGLLESLDRDELQGVVAHEIGHIRNRDILYLTIAGVMMGTVVILADGASRMLFWGGGRRRTSRDGGGNALILVLCLALVVLSPILAQLLYFALSRRREYLADASSAIFTRYPDGLASALEKISGSAEKLATANRASAPMFIVNPLKVGAGGLADLSRTHPPTSERIRILRSLAGRSISWEAYDRCYRHTSGRAVGVVPASLRKPEAGGQERAPSPDGRSHLERVREATDALWRLNAYGFIACACGTTLKVPPEHRQRTIPCPHCGTEHRAASTRASG